MRNWFWVGVIALALTAIIGGFLEGSTANPPPVVQLHGRPPTSAPSRDGALYAQSHAATDAAVDDLFSDDDVVVERARTISLDWQPERMSIVVGLCGESFPIESGFLRSGLPLTIDLDPKAGDAARFADAARSAGDRLYVHVSQVPSAATLADLRRRFGALDGVAALSPGGMPAALAGTGLAFFDEEGEADARPFALRGVDFAQRDATVDDRSTQSYTAYMLESAAARSRREGPVVVLMRPLPSSLAALSQFVQTSHAEILGLR